MKKIYIVGELNFPTEKDVLKFTSKFEKLLLKQEVHSDTICVSFYEEDSDAGIDLQEHIDLESGSVKTSHEYPKYIVDCIADYMDAFNLDSIRIAFVDYKVKAIEIDYDVNGFENADEVVLLENESIELYVEYNGCGYIFKPDHSCSKKLEKEVVSIMELNGHNKAMLKISDGEILSYDGELLVPEILDQFSQAKELSFQLEQLLIDKHLNQAFRLTASGLDPRKWNLNIKDPSLLDFELSDSVISTISFIISNLATKTFRLDWSGSEFNELFPIDKMAAIDEQADLIEDLIEIEFDSSETNTQNELLDTFDEELSDALEILRKMSEEVALLTDNEDYLSVYETTKEDVEFVKILNDTLHLYENFLISYIIENDTRTKDVYTLFKDYKYHLDIVENLYPGTHFVNNFAKISAEFESMIELDSNYFSEANLEALEAELKNHLNEEYNDSVLTLVVSYDGEVAIAYAQNHYEKSLEVDSFDKNIDDKLLKLVSTYVDISCADEVIFHWNVDELDIDLNNQERISDSFDKNGIRVISLDDFKNEMQEIHFDLNDPLSSIFVESDVFASAISKVFGFEVNVSESEDIDDIGDLSEIHWESIFDPSNFEGMDEILFLDEKYIYLNSDEDNKIGKEKDEVSKELSSDDYIDSLIPIVSEAKNSALSGEEAQEYIKKELENLGFSRENDELSPEEELEFMKN